MRSFIYMQTVESLKKAIIAMDEKSTPDKLEQYLQWIEEGEWNLIHCLNESIDREGNTVLGVLIRHPRAMPILQQIFSVKESPSYGVQLPINIALRFEHLVIALQCGRSDVLELLWKQYKNFGSGALSYYYDMLLWSVTHNDSQLFLFLEENIDSGIFSQVVSMTDQYTKNNFLHIAIQNQCDTRIIERLSVFLSISATNADEQNALHMVAEYGDILSYMPIFYQNAQIQSALKKTDRWGRPPLEIAVFCGKDFLWKRVLRDLRVGDCSFMVASVCSPSSAESSELPQQKLQQKPSRWHRLTTALRSSLFPAPPRVAEHVRALNAQARRAPEVRVSSPQISVLQQNEAPLRGVEAIKLTNGF